MKNKSIAAVGAVLALAALFTSAEPLGTAFTYKGKLADGDNPAHGSYDIKFTLYGDASGGSAVAGPVTLSPVAVTNGEFNAVLDFGAGAFAGDARWVELGVRTNGAGAYTVLSPRQQVEPLPYAMYSPNAGVAITATTAASANSVAAANITGTISPNNIGAGSITTAMLAAGAVGAGQLAAGAVTAGALADGAVTAAKIATLSGPLLVTTFTNPTPETGDNFGYAIAAMGTDRALIGAGWDDSSAVNSGTAYLFRTDGTLLTTFTNPTPAADDLFGSTVAALGTDRVLIGATGEGGGTGVAYQFSTSGALLTTFTNPAPRAGDGFGSAMTALGADRVLIAAYNGDAGTTDAGVVYLFSTNGALLTTFTNPTPAANDYFGNSLATLGTDRVVIGAPLDDAMASDGGVAYLFNTNGTLLASFSNPSPGPHDLFANTLAAVGTDYVLMGVPWGDLGALDAGAAYLFDTNGSLVTTFVNPTPAVADYFGHTVTALGAERVVISAFFDNTGAARAGAAYVFSTNGTLLLTLTNPVPAAWDTFGVPMAGLGNDRVLVGVPNKDTGATDAGEVYLLTISADRYTPGLIAEGVKSGSISTANLQDGAVTASKVGGVLLASQIPDLDGAKITSGVLDANRIPDLDAAKLTSGTLADARLSANVALLSANQVFTGSNRFTGVIEMINVANSLAGTFSGDGSGLANLNAAQLTGTISPANIAAGTISGTMLAAGTVGSDQIAPGAVTTGVLADGAVTASKVGGVLLASQIPDLDGAKITSGVLTDTRLSANVAMRAGGNAFTGNQTVASGSMGVGTTSPASLLTVVKSTAGGRGGEISIVNLAASTAGNEAALNFGLESTTYNGDNCNAQIKARVMSSSDRRSDLVFSTWNGTTFGERMRLRSDGNVGIGTSSFTSNRLEVAGMVGATAFNTTSDRAAKQDFMAVDSQAVLAKVAALPLTQWRFKDFPDAPHLGPMAQDFRAAFGLGVDDKSIATLDADGVALAAIQGLNQKVESENAALRAENAELKARLERLEQLVKARIGGAK